MLSSVNKERHSLRLEQMDGPSEELTGARCLATNVCQIDSVVKGRSDGLGPASGAARRDAAADDVDEEATTGGRADFGLSVTKKGIAEATDAIYAGWETREGSGMPHPPKCRGKNTCFPEISSGAKD
jgi:hypothetical protein